MRLRRAPGKFRVFVGPGNTAGNASWIAESLHRAGIYARSYAYGAHVFGYEVDHSIRQFRSLRRRGLIKLLNNRYVLRPVNAVIRLAFFLSVIFRYDLFYFISPVTFFHRHQDLWWLRLFGKKIAFFFPGCAEKDPADPLNQMKYSDCWYCDDIPKQRHCLCHQPLLKKARIRKFEKYAHFIFSRPNTSGYLRHPEKTFPMWLMTDPPPKKNLISKFDGPEAFRIVHFPSNKSLKGTRYVEAAIFQLQEKFGLDYVSRPMKNREVLKQLEEAHIVVDQFTHTFGLLTIEAMSRGCVVICRMEDWAREIWPDVPVVSCDPEDVVATLQGLLADPARMKEIGQQSLDWFHQNATPEIVGKKLGNVFLDGLGPRHFMQPGKEGVV